MSLPHIAIGGKMQVGKTTCADHLAARFGYEKYALADPIKEIARREFGWDGTKDERGRRLLQEIGTVGRAYDPALWLRRFEAWLAGRGDGAGTPVVVDDLRLPQEVDYLRARGFRILIVVRPGFRAPTSAGLGGHETETGLERVAPDLILRNAGTIADLHARLEDGLVRLRAGAG